METHRPQGTQPLGKEMGEVDHGIADPAGPLFHRPAKRRRNRQGGEDPKETPKSKSNRQMQKNGSRQDQEEEILEESEDTVHQQGLDLRDIGAETAQQVALTEALHLRQRRMQALCEQSFPDLHQDRGREFGVNQTRAGPKDEIGKRQSQHRQGDARHQGKVLLSDHRVDEALADQRGCQGSRRPRQTEQEQPGQKCAFAPQMSVEQPQSP